MIVGVKGIVLVIIFAHCIECQLYEMLQLIMVLYDVDSHTKMFRMIMSLLMN